MASHSPSAPCTGAVRQALPGQLGQRGIRILVTGAADHGAVSTDRQGGLSRLVGCGERVGDRLVDLVLHAEADRLDQRVREGRRQALDLIDYVGLCPLLDGRERHESHARGDDDGRQRHQRRTFHENGPNVERGDFRQARHGILR
ncbi:hypothetical protein [Citreimonas sp.]|uniref:hypothetical protein n=1 Tax=Citreimonas sp. TaxID=3036715 RepID=UPI0040599A9E